MQSNYKQMYDTLLKEYQKLQVELEETKKILETYTGEKIEIPQPQPTSVNQLGVDEFISLYMDLFQGRTDVYTKWFHNTNTGRKGYSPHCHNEWVKGVCEKPKIKCYSCPNKNFKPLTRDVIKAHLQGKQPFGRDTIGIYPVLEDETCYFLAVDFDGNNWQADVTALREVCIDKNIPIYIERSKSGLGGHAWFFFYEKIPIKLARKLGNLLITHTMNIHHQLKLTSYDRLFPNQDYLPKGGLGNLIALPLQGSAVRNENSVFVDEAFNMIPNQRQLIATIKKLSLKHIQEVCEDLRASGDLGKLMEPSEKTKPWEQKQLSLTLSKSDFPEQVKIIFANRVYVDKNRISSRSLNEIKRLAAFSNPEFYEKLRYRLSIHKTERIIDCSLEDEHYLSIPRGCLDKVLELLDGANVIYEIEDKRFKGTQIAVAFSGKLYEEQEIAFQKLLAYETGILAATTAFGKTVIAANLIAERKVNTLVLVHTSTFLS